MPELIWVPLLLINNVSTAQVFGQWKMCYYFGTILHCTTDWVSNETENCTSSAALTIFIVPQFFKNVIWQQFLIWSISYMSVLSGSGTCLVKLHITVSSSSEWWEDKISHTVFWFNCSSLDACCHQTFSSGSTYINIVIYKKYKINFPCIRSV